MNKKCQSCNWINRKQNGFQTVVRYWQIQGSHQPGEPGKPGKHKELKVKNKTQGKLRKFLAISMMTTISKNLMIVPKAELENLVKNLK